ncbi:MAG: Hsp70 family protein [Myxococcota bacterium]
MSLPERPLPTPGSRVRVRVAGRPEVSEGTVENVSEDGVVLRLLRPPDLGVMTLIEFLSSDQTVLLRRTACMVFRRGQSDHESTTVALEFVDLVATPSRKESLLTRFLQVFGRGARTPDPALERGLPPPPRSGPILGIDLGTVNSCVACVLDGSVRVLGDGEVRTFPSVVHFDVSGRRRVGHAARAKMVLEPTRTVFGSKRFLGRPFASEEVRRWGHFFPYQLVQGAGGATAVKMGHDLFPLEEVSKEILKALKLQAESALGVSVHRAVISVPADFGEPQREAVHRSGRLAGLWVERLINEPTAAAVAYGHRRELDRHILVYDLGGGTFDVSILRVTPKELEVLSSGGDPFLGGADFDDRLTEYILTRFEGESGVHLGADVTAIQKIRFAAEAAKIQLSDRDEAEIFLPKVTTDPPRNLSVTIARVQFEAMVGDLIDRTLRIAETVLEQADIKADDIDEVVLVGGQTQTPAVRHRLQERFGQKLSQRVNPDEAVALGAAIVAASLEGGDLEADPVKLKDILTASIQWSTNGRDSQVILPRGSRLPATASFDVPRTTTDMAPTLRLYRGESKHTEENAFIGSLDLSELSRTTGALAHLDVSAEGLLSVRVRRPGDQEFEQLVVNLVDPEL